MEDPRGHYRGEENEPFDPEADSAVPVPVRGAEQALTGHGRMVEATPARHRSRLRPSAAGTAALAARDRGAIG